MTRKKSKLHLFKAITQYGIHIWAILLIANAALAFAFHFSTQASPKTHSIITDVNDAQPSEAPTPTPHGQLIDLTFTVPGIGSGGGTLQPKRLKRNVTVYLYSSDVNSMNNTVKPLYTIKSTVNYDNDSNSPLYTTFANHALDLGVNVKDGNYQMAFRTDESLRTVIKDTPNAVGGQILPVAKDGQLLALPVETVLMGDTVPTKVGDNVIDIADYNAFINCFGERNSTNFCNQNNYGDYDDNGVINGVDYNILLRTFQALLQQGQVIPQISVIPTRPQRVSRLSNLNTPTPNAPTAINKAPLAKPTPVVAKSTQSAGNVLAGILFFFFLIIVGMIGFLYLKNENFRNKIKAIIHLSPTGTPAEPQTEETPAEASAETPAANQPTEEAPVTPEEQTPEAAATPDAGTAEEQSPEDIAASTEIPIPTKDAHPPADTPTPDGTIDKSCYVKKRLADDAKTGFWLTLTDDNGAMEAHYTTKDVADGFAHVKGVMKEADGKKFLEVSELTPEG